MSGWLDTKVLNVLQKGLEASSLRQQVLTNNIANIDTPNFKRSDVNFQAVLGQAMGENPETLPLKQTSPRQLPGISEDNGNVIVTDNSTSMRNDGNNVDVNQEMTNVAENGLYYSSLTQAISSQFALLQMVTKSTGS